MNKESTSKILKNHGNEESEFIWKFLALPILSRNITGERDFYFMAQKISICNQKREIFLDF